MTSFNRFSNGSLWVLAAALLLLAPPASAQKSEKTADAPGFSLKTKAKERTPTDATEVSIIANIDNQKLILELEDRSSPDYPRMMVALADFNWALSEVYFRRSESDDLEQRIYDAEEAKDKDALARATAEQAELRKKRRTYQRKTVEVYRQVVNEYPKAGALDEFRYFLGYHLTAMDEPEAGRASYQELIRNHPGSTYVPDALVNIGEYYFEENDYANALKLYQAVEQFPEAPIIVFAIYKQAWCHYNLAAYDLSLGRLVDVIKRAESGEANAIELRSEAQAELIYPYSKIGKPSAAIAFFKRYAPEKYLRLAANLATLFTEGGQYSKSDRVLRALIKRVLKPKSGEKDQKYRVVKYQRLVVDNQYRQSDKQATVEEVRELIRLFEQVQASAPKDFMAKEATDIATMILGIATGYHTEYETTKEQKTLEMTQMLYDEYLRIFKEGANIYDITMNNAKLLMLTGKYDQAAAEFEKVISLNPKGKYADQAAETAVIAYLRSIKVDRGQLTEAATADLSELPLSAEAQQFVQAVDRWMDVISRNGLDPDSAENVPKALYLAAKLLYNYNHFKASADRFAVLVEKYPGDPLVVESARHVLSAYSLGRDVDNLKKYANAYEKRPKLMATDVAEDVRQIKNEFDYLECFRFEKAKAHIEAATCFLDYAKAYPKDRRAPSSIFNGGVNYFAAKKVERALETYKRLYETYATDELAPKALYAIGEVYERTTVYDQAAYIYEFFVANHSDHALAKKALRSASIFRKTLGEYEQAIANLTLYLKMFPGEDSAPRVHLDIIKIRGLQNRPTHVIKSVRSHLKSFRDEAPAVRIEVLMARAKSYQVVDDDRKALAGFTETVDYFNTLDTAQIGALTPVAVGAVAEAHFNLGELALKKVKRVKVSGSDKKVKAALERKAKLLQAAREIYEQVILYNHPGWSIAAYTQVGAAYQDFSEAIENTPAPAKIRRFQEAVDEFRGVMATRAEPFRMKAIESYQMALTIARRDHWFNEYSEMAEAAIAQLDLKDRSIKEYRLRPDRIEPNAGLPDFKEAQR